MNNLSNIMTSTLFLQWGHNYYTPKNTEPT